MRFCLSLPATFTRLLDLPGSEETTLRQMIPFELERHMPFPYDQVRADHTVLENSKDGMSLTLVAVVRKEEFRPIGQLIDQMALRHPVCTLSCLAAAEFVAQRFNPGRPDEAIAVVDSRPSQTTTTIYNGGGAFLTRTVGQLKEHQLVVDLRRTIGGFHSSFRGVKVSRCVFAGENAAEVAPSAEKGLGIPVEVLDLWRDVEPPPSCDEDPQRYFVATAMAMQEESSRLSINLLTAQQVLNRSQQRRIGWGVVTAAAVALIVGGSYHSFSAALHAREAELARVQSQTQRLQRSTPTLKRTIGLSRQKPPQRTGRRPSMADARLIESLARDARRSSLTWLEVLRILSAKLPEKVWLSELACEKDNRVTLNGTAPTNADVAGALQTLEKTGFFAEVRLVHSRVTEAKGEAGFQFQIACTMNTSGVSAPSSAGAGRLVDRRSVR